MAEEEQIRISDGKTIRNAPLPELLLGRGAVRESIPLLRRYGAERVCLVTGRASYEGLPEESKAEQFLQEAGFTVVRYPVSGEPSPDTVDRVRDAARGEELQAVLALGGGSVLDTGKAVAAMLRHEGGVAEYLEGVGEKEPGGQRMPFIAAPTTAGTGSEATKNAVISRTGPAGFKKSLRHTAFVPDAAILDPQLSRACPQETTAASGLDAVTQLLEAYVSSAGTPFTSMCALEGLSRAGKWLERVVEQGDELEGRAQMAYAAYLSGVALASAGLGVVHGAAGVLGGMRSIPHGVVCGTLLGEATRRVLAELQSRAGGDEADSEAAAAALTRYTRAAAALTGMHEGDPEELREGMLRLFENWIGRFGLARLGSYGFTREELQSAAAKIKMKQTPASLEEGEVFEMLSARL